MMMCSSCKKERTWFPLCGTCLEKQLADKDAEIERLKNENRWLNSKVAQYALDSICVKDTSRQPLIDQIHRYYAEIKRLKSAIKEIADVNFLPEHKLCCSCKQCWTWARATKEIDCDEEYNKALSGGEE